MFLIKKITLANRIIKVYKRLKELIENNKNYSDEVKAAFDLYKQGSEKLIKIIPSLKDLYNEILDVLKNS